MGQTKSNAGDKDCVGPTQRSRAEAGPPDGNLEIECVLDRANNRLQELMQLLYLLGRDPAIPKDARYHVTIAQSEIALLTRQMQNAAATRAPEAG